MPTKRDKIKRQSHKCYFAMKKLSELVDAVWNNKGIDEGYEELESKSTRALHWTF